MHLLDRIDYALETKTLKAEEFERFAQDVLGAVYPGLVPIAGGTDWGRDADVPSSDGSSSTRVVITRSKQLKGVQDNLRRSLRSLSTHGQRAERIVLANLAVLSARDRDRLEKTAGSYGATIVASYDRVFFAHRLRQNGEWRRRLLDIPSDPIAVARLPAELTDSSWVRIPLVGRNDELAALTADTSDVVVSGSPGCGKSRLLAELDDAVFVDRDATIGVLLDDLRLLQPSLVVIDDAGDRLDIVRQVRTGRGQEPDNLHFRIIAVCWPDETETVSDALPNADRVEVNLLERALMDQIIQGMGVSGLLARSEILAQAEGRPGWAVALADVLLSTRQPGALLSGKALLGHVHRYLRRRRIADSSDALAVVAALGGVDHAELQQVAAELGISQATLVSVMRSASRSGLVDVTNTWSPEGQVRTYRVRPPMLADALAAERLFAEDVPAIDILGLFDRWPAHRGSLTCAAIDAVRLDVTQARGTAARFFERVMSDENVAAEDRRRVAGRFGRLSATNAKQVLDLFRPEFDEQIASFDETMGWQVEPYLKFASDFARWLLPEAIHMLLDAAAVDHRPTNSHPRHPVRLLQDLVTSFHPELAFDPRMPVFLIDAAGSWLVDQDGEPRAWGAYAEAATAALSISREGSYGDPGHPMRINIFRTVASPIQINLVLAEVWPNVRTRLPSAPATAFARVLDAIERWLHIGAGHDAPFGNPHPAEHISAAALAGEMMLRDVAALAPERPGIAARVNALGSKHGLDIHVELPAGLEPFFAEIEVRKNREERQQQLQDAVAGAVYSWHTQEPTEVCQKLVDLRAEIALAGRLWPSRIRMAVDAVALNITDLVPWIEAALDAGLFPDADGFIAEHRRRGRRFTAELIERTMGVPAARPVMVRNVLGDRHADADEISAVLPLLTGDDYGAIEDLIFADPGDERLRQLLVEAGPAVRAATAAAMASQLHGIENWTPGPLEAEWLEALEAIFDVPGIADYNLEALFEFVARSHPNRYISLLEATQHSEQGSSRIGSATIPLLDAASHLPSEAKSKLMANFATTSEHRWAVLDHIVGTDANWLAGALDDGLITTREALSVGGLGPRPPIQDLARVLIRAVRHRLTSRSSSARAPGWATSLTTTTDFESASLGWPSPTRSPSPALGAPESRCSPPKPRKPARKNGAPGSSAGNKRRRRLRRKSRGSLLIERPRLLPNHPRRESASAGRHLPSAGPCTCPEAARPGSDPRRAAASSPRLRPARRRPCPTAGTPGAR